MVIILNQLFNVKATKPLEAGNRCSAQKAYTIKTKYISPVYCASADNAAEFALIPSWLHMYLSLK